ncbi:MAG TPA: S8 family serine peptidase, partial [Nodularia sp. (in: cyanobacteria)]|nr:S8 family serine peptidase [Nodularia sp. (in: cyanobacteria)]
ANNWGLAVGAVDSDNKMANFSNQAGMNAFPYVTAPGVDIYSSVPGNQYATYSGTSMATPHVVGVVALMLSANPSLTDAQIRQLIIETSGNSTPAASSNSLSISPEISRTIADMVGNSTSPTTVKVELQVTMLTDSNTAVSNLPPMSSFVTRGSSMNLGNMTWYYDRISNNIFNADEGDKKNEDPTDIATILNQLQQQVEEFRRFFPGF